MKADLPDFDRLWDYDRPRETERSFRAVWEEVGDGADPSYRAELLTQIARTQGMQRQFEAAHQTLDDAEKLLEESAPRVRVRYVLERGRVFNSSRQVERAGPLFEQAWELALAQGLDFHAIDAAHMLAIVAPPEQQLAWNLKALDLAERSAEARAQGWRGSLYNNIGWSYHDQGRYPEALEVFGKALQYREEHGSAGEIHIARWCVGRALRSLGRLTEALELQRALLEQLDAVEDSDGYVHEELGECLLALGQQDAARAHFARAHEVLSQDAWLVENEGPRLQRLKELAETRG